MPLVQINAVKDRVALANGETPEGLLRRRIRDLPAGAPVVILIHGFKFSPSRPGRSPHDHILSMTPDPHCWKALSWPRHLGFDANTPERGLCIAFGWEASGSIWTAYREAARAGRALAGLVRMIRQIRPDQPVDAMAHSLGARVVFTALPHLADAPLRRAVLLTPAEITDQAETALDTPAGQAMQVLNITSRENDLFDLMLEWTVALHRPGRRGLSYGVRHPRPNWLNVQIDNPRTLDALRGLGHAIAPPDRRICHWSPYLRPGVFSLYSAFLNGTLPLDALRPRLPETACPRWSRLLALPAVSLPLPFAGKAPS